jgi:hypothetical protein
MKGIYRHLINSSDIGLEAKGLTSRRLPELSAKPATKRARREIAARIMALKAIFGSGAQHTLESGKLSGFVGCRSFKPAIP